MNGPTTETEYQTSESGGSGANVETSDDRMQIASLTRRMQVHNTDVYTPLGVGVYTCVNGPMTGAVSLSPSPSLSLPLFPSSPLRSAAPRRSYPPSHLLLASTSSFRLSSRARLPTSSSLSLPLSRSFAYSLPLFPSLVPLRRSGSRSEARGTRNEQWKLSPSFVIYRVAGSQLEHVHLVLFELLLEWAV